MSGVGMSRVAGMSGGMSRQYAQRGWGYVQGMGMFRGGGYTWDLGYPPPPVLTSSGGHQNTYGFQVGGAHPT